jgi:hypothetical protein
MLMIWTMALTMKFRAGAGGKFPVSSAGHHHQQQQEQ